MKKTINETLVSLFSNILHKEEAYFNKILDEELSMKDVHLIEAIYETSKNSPTTLKKISDYLNISQSRLSGQLNRLINKNYIYKKRDTEDKRKYHIFLTYNGEFVNEEHQKFHTEMIDKLLDPLTKDEAKLLLTALQNLKTYFN